jgi:predicted nucleic acid-binding protein
VIVADASAAILGLLNDGDARRVLASETVVVPHLADSEIAHTLRSQVIRRRIDDAAARIALDRWARLGVRRVGVTELLPRIWALRENLSAYDATYVALAEAFDVALLTADVKIAGAPGPTCPISVVRR